MVGLVGRQQAAGEAPGLFPQCRGVHVEPVAGHLPNLALQGQVIRELRDRHVHGEVDRVAATRHELVGTERRLDPGPAAAAVLLALVADDAEGPLDYVDLVRLLELARHRLEIAPARAARLVGLIELVDDLDDRERLLLAGTVTGLRLLRLLGLRVAVRSSLGRVAEERLGAARELLLEMRDLELEGLRLVTACVAQLAGEPLQALEEPRVLLLQQERGLAQPLDVRLRRQVQQRCASWRNGVRTCGEVVGGESRKAPANVLPSRKSASSLGVSSHTSCSSRRHNNAKRPRSSRFW